MNRGNIYTNILDIYIALWYNISRNSTRKKKKR